MLRSLSAVAASALLLAPAVAAASAGLAESIDDALAVDAALASDDQCREGDSECAAQLLQLRGAKTTLAANETEQGYYACSVMGCDAKFQGHKSCQCNAACLDYNNCCYDHSWICRHHYSMHEQTYEEDSSLLECSGTTKKEFKLDWEAKGETFFDEFTFVTIDDVHGAHQFTNESEAEEEGVITTENGTAQMRFGGLRAPSFEGEAWKRYSTNIHTNMAWDPQVGFLAVLHYKSMPWGCGIWPSFWAMNSDKVWPGGGELDMLEFANTSPNKASFHLSGKCHLDRERAKKCQPPGMSRTESFDCDTNYFLNKLGCMPNQRQPDGEFFAKYPGVFAAEWTHEHIIIYHIPEEHIPQDLRDDLPETSGWKQWIIAYLPLTSECEDVIGPQELVINMQLCGDWAGATFGQYQCASVGSEYLYGCHKGLSQPIDCCTKYVTDEKQDGVLQAQMWDIVSLKVFTHNGEKGQESGTFKRGGLPPTP